jgi:hypothetical protein
MDIDEVIQEYEELAECWIAKSHELSCKYKQIAEWLKELKQLKVQKCSYALGYKDGYVNAIDKALEIID